MFELINKSLQKNIQGSMSEVHKILNFVCVNNKFISVYPRNKKGHCNFIKKGLFKRALSDQKGHSKWALSDQKGHINFAISMVA